MIDSYLWGKVERISPEAPVPVVNVQKRVNRLGGAANVALNIKSMGAYPILCAACGKDAKAAELMTLLNEANLSTEGIISCDDRITTTKFRIIGNNSQMLRVDEETDTPLRFEDTELLIHKIRNIVQDQKPDLIIFEDYDKGLIGSYLIENVIALANSNSIPVSVDPKKRNFWAYRNITLFKPNLKELREGTKTDLNSGNFEMIEETLNELREKQYMDMVLLTLSEAGMIISYEDKSMHIPSVVRSVSDVSGAGDTVISVAALAHAAGASPQQMTLLANLAGGLVCAYTGVVPVKRSELLTEAHKCLSHE